MVGAASLGALASRLIETESLPRVETSPGSRIKAIYHDPATGMPTVALKKPLLERP